MTRRRQADPDSGLQRVTTIPRIPPRPADAHKGRFGRVLVIGGSRGMIGAPALVANAALRSGAGLVTVACPRSIQTAVATLCPCATTVPLAETARGILDPARSVKQWEASGLFDGAAAPTALAAGPGLGTGGAVFKRGLIALLDAFRRRTEARLVLDADALNALAPLPFDARAAGAAGKRPAGLKRLAGRSILTPHPGEMARLWGVDAAEIQRDRERFAVETARRLSGEPAATGDDARAARQRSERVARSTAERTTGHRRQRVARDEDERAARDGDERPARDGDERPARREDERAVVVLKGAGTLVTDGLRLYANPTGNPGMATGGSGDVLTGVVAALVAQGLPRFDAAILAVHLHGRAGDLAARRFGQVSLIATDLIDALPEAVLETGDLETGN